MEYFQRCELNELLVRVNESVSNNATLPDNEKKLEYIPSRILWRLFLCRELFALTGMLSTSTDKRLSIITVTKACVGMAYPPPQYYGRPDTYREVIIPDQDPELIIHFDMHPLNGNTLFECKMARTC